MRCISIRNVIQRISLILHVMTSVVNVCFILNLMSIGFEFIVYSFFSYPFTIFHKGLVNDIQI